MKNDSFDAVMRSMERYHAIKVPVDEHLILRIDGRNFSNFTEKFFLKPIDGRFQRIMVNTTVKLVEELSATYGYVESDEISILLPQGNAFFDREVEKLVSISASLASSVFLNEFLKVITPITDIYPHFDSRIIVCKDKDDVADYFRWRQSDANRCALNGYTYWSLRKNGLTQSQATRKMEGISKEEKLKMLSDFDINYFDLDSSYRNGIGIYWEEYDKVGFNPITKEEVVARRKQIIIDEYLPTKSEYGNKIWELMGL